MDSLLDIGGAVKNAIALGNYQQDVRRNDLTQQNLALRQQQQLTDQQNANTQYMNSIHSFLKDDRAKFDPQMENALMNRWAALAGAPPVDFNRVRAGREAKKKLMQSAAMGDQAGVVDAYGEIAMGLDVKDIPEFLKSVEGIPEIHERVRAMVEAGEMKTAEFQKIKDNNAMIDYARPLYTATSSAFRDQLRMMDSPDAKKLQSLYATMKKSGGDVSGLLSSRQTPGINKQNVAPLLDGGLANMALKADAEVQRLHGQIQDDAKLLDDHAHGIPLPDGLTPSILKARIDTDSALKGAYQTMQEWYEEPLDKAKYTGAQEALKAIEQRRLDVEALDKSNSVNAANVQQQTLKFNQEKEQFKRNQDAALADAQVEYAALPAKQQTPQSAARIAKAIRESTGMAVTPEDIAKGAKNPNAPQSTTSVDVRLAGKLSDKAAGRIDKGANTAEAAVTKVHTINRMYDAISSGNVNVGPGANVQQFLGQIGSKIGSQGKNAEERLANTRIVIQGLADLVLQNREKLEGQGQVSNYESQLAERAAIPGEIDKFSIPELKALMAVADRAARMDYDNFQQKLSLLRNDKDEAIRKEAQFFEPPTMPKSRFGGTQENKTLKSSGKPAYGNRPDGTPKGLGYFGEISSPVTPGEISTELTIGVNIGGKETDIPLLTPNLSRSEIEAVMRGRESEAIIKKAAEHAKARMRQGKSPYAEDGEVRALPDWKPKEFDSFYNSLRKGDVYVGPDGKRRTKK